MVENVDLATALASAVAHELGNQLQPLTTALRFVQKESPPGLAPHLELAADALAACSAVAEQLRTASFAGHPPHSFSMLEAVEEATETLAEAQRAVVRIGPGHRRQIQADRGAVVLALSHVLSHAVTATRGRGPVDIEVLAANPVARVSFGPAAPVRDDPPPRLSAAAPTVRMTTGLAMAWVLSARAWGIDSLHVAQGAGSGRFEFWVPEGP